MLLGPLEQAAEKKRQLIDSFEKLLGGQCAVAVREVSPRELACGPAAPARVVPGLEALGVVSGAEDGFGALLSHLALLLQREKESSTGWAVAGHGQNRCEECGIRPGSETGNWSGATGRVCRRCLLFHQEGSKEKGLPTLEDFQGAPAYLHIDGSRVGARLQGLRSLGEYVVFSRALHSAFSRQALEDSMAALGFHEDTWVPVIAGGDDLQLIFDSATTASREDVRGPVELAVRLLKGIEARFDQAMAGQPLKKEDQVGAGAGVAVGKHLPAALGFVLARELCKSAKRAQSRSALDFELVQAGSMIAGEVKAMRRQKQRTWFTPPGQAAVFHYTARPYTLDDAGALIGLSREVVGSRGAGGRSALYGIRAALADDPMAGLVSAAYLLARLPDCGLRRAMALSAQQLGGPLEQFTAAAGGTPLLRYLPDEQEDELPHWCTAVPDLVDLVTLVERTRQP